MATFSSTNPRKIDVAISTTSGATSTYAVPADSEAIVQVYWSSNAGGTLVGSIGGVEFFRKTAIAAEVVTFQGIRVGPGDTILLSGAGATTTSITGVQLTNNF